MGVWRADTPTYLGAYLPYVNQKRAPTGRNTMALRRGAGLGCAEGALSCISARVDLVATLIRLADG